MNCKVKAIIADTIQRISESKTNDILKKDYAFRKVGDHFLMTIMSITQGTEIVNKGTEDRR